MDEFGWRKTEQLISEFVVEDVEIMDAIKKRKINAHDRNFRKLKNHQIQFDRLEAYRMNELKMEVYKTKLRDPENKNGYCPIEFDCALDDCLFRLDDAKQIWKEKKPGAKKNRRRVTSDLVFEKAKELRKENPKITKAKLYDHPEIVKIYGGEKVSLKTFRDRHLKGL